MDQVMKKIKFEHEKSGLRPFRKLKSDPHITGLPGIWCSVFTASPDVSDFFLPKIGQKCQIGDFWGYSGPNLATL